MKKKWIKCKLDNKPYVLDLVGFEGISINPFVEDEEAGEILLPKGFQKNKECMYLVLHELTHCTNWELSEKKVVQMSTEMTEVMWRLYKARDEVR